MPRPGGTGRDRAGPVGAAAPGRAAVDPAGTTGTGAVAVALAARGREDSVARRSEATVLLDVLLVAAALSTALVSGLLLGFAVVAMPGLGTLDDRSFLRGFKAMDAMIQGRQPLFMLLWLGSVVSVVAAAAVGIGVLAGGPRAALVVSAALYLLGVQLPTVVVNIPLNDRVQAVDLDAATEEEVADLRRSFEPRWTRWNTARSAVGVVAAALLLVVVLVR